MDVDLRLCNLLFLCSIAPIGLGCPAPDDGEQDSEPGPDPGTSTTTADQSTTTGGPPPVDTAGHDGSTSTASGSSGTTTGATTRATDDTSSTDGGDTTTTDEATGTTTDTPPNLCTAYGAHLGACAGALGYDEAYYAMYFYAVCQYQLTSAATYGAACVALMEDYLACISTADCQDWIDGVACLPELQAIQCGPP